MEIVLLLTAIVAAFLAVGCSITGAYEIAVGRMRFLTSPSFWGFVIFHFATGMIAIWLFGLWLGY